MNPLLKEEVLDLISKVSKMMNGLDLPDYVDNKNKCTTCVHKELCYDKDGIDKLLHEIKNSSNESKTTIKE
jgi:hypothetical protein